MASIDFISCNAEHCKRGPISVEKAEVALYKEKHYAESRGHETRMWQTGKKLILEIDESEPPFRITRHVVVNYNDNDTYGRCR